MGKIRYYFGREGGFYPSDIYATPPEGAVEITAELYETLKTSGRPIMPPDDDHDLPWLQTPDPITLDQARTAKLAEIIDGSNRAAAYLKSRYSEAEAESWPQQEAGARAILGNETDVKDDAAAAILQNEARAQKAVTLVRTLASIDGATDAEFAVRIASNADAAYGAKILTLTEQRSHEKALKDSVVSGDVAAVQALAIHYTLPPKEIADEQA